MEKISYIEKEKIDYFFSMLNEFEIRYVLIKNIGEELPNKLVDGKDIDIIVNENDRRHFEEIMKKAHFQIQEPPFGVSKGWRFMYGLPEYQFWKLDSYEKNLLIDVSYKIACKSLMPRTWIPLNQKIQERIWQKKCWNKECNWWDMDRETRFVYYMVRCIFDKQVFSDKYIEEIESIYLEIDMKVVRELLEVIFFRYTDRLLFMVKQKKYNEIRQDYISFSDY